MREETFFNYKNFKWMWVHLIALTIILIVYALHDPIGEPAGDTWLGYTLGVLAAAGMTGLMWYAIRKRAYYSSQTTLKGALAVHLWLGLSLSLLVPLHCGFSFGMNVHTLAYVLMMLTILTGVWGAIIYLSMAKEIGSHRGKGSVKELLEKLTLTSTAADSLTLKKSPSFISLAQKLDFNFYPTLRDAVFEDEIAPLDQSALARQIAELKSEEQSDAVKFIGIVSRKIELINLIRQEVKAQFWMKAWLYLHVPLACLSYAALLIHIISVFYYR